MFGRRLHTIPDVDAGRIPDNRSGVTTLGKKLPHDTAATNPWYFGAANQRFYSTNANIKGSFRGAGASKGKGLY